MERHLFKILLILGCLILASNLAMGQAVEVVPGEFIVKFKAASTTTTTHSKLIGKISQKAKLQGSYGSLRMHYFKTNPGFQNEQVMNELKADPDVEYVEPNFVLRKSIDTVGAQSAPMSLDQVKANSTSSYFSQNGADVQVVESWSQMSGSSSMTPVVAIIDSGVDYDHEVFRDSNAIWQNSNEIANNGIDDDGNGYIDDVRGWNFFNHTNNPMDDEDHGTHVAGIVLGAGLDIFATQLDQATIKIMPLKFLGSDGSGTTAKAIEAINYAINNGAQVINNSWGGTAYSQGLHDALTNAYAHSVLIVAAAGNYGSDNDATPLYPASYPIPGLLSIAASSDSDRLATFSNYGASSVHIAAPGVSILSTVRHNAYSYMSGTSMAAPFMAGISALALREAPGLSSYQIRNLLLNSAQTKTNFNGKILTGARVNSLNSIINAKSQAGTQSYQPGYSPDNSRAPASDSGGGGKGGCGMVSLLGSGPNDGPGGFNMVAVCLIALPMVIWAIIRSTYRERSPLEKRRFERFMMHSQVRIRMSGKEWGGELNTISLGGVSFESEAVFDKGGKIRLEIMSPDGKEHIEVDGQIVWNSENRKYGVQFGETNQSTLQSIQSWVQRFVQTPAGQAT